MLDLGSGLGLEWYILLGYSEGAEDRTEEFVIDLQVFDYQMSRGRMVHTVVSFTISEAELFICLTVFCYVNHFHDQCINLK